MRWDPVTRLLYSLEGSECVIRSLHEGGRVLVNHPPVFRLLFAMHLVNIEVVPWIVLLCHAVTRVQQC